MPLSLRDKVPGVYIDEIQVPGPIPGVGTSTVAIIGPARYGPINTPTLVTNPTQFTDNFGGFISTLPVYSTHAVHGFFANGGTSCYFVRVSTAAHASLDLADGSADPGRTTAVVTAKKEGLVGNNIQVQIGRSSIATGREIVKADANLTAAADTGTNEAEVDDASDFRSSDIVLIEEGVNSERLAVANADTTTNTITFVRNLINTYAVGGTIRIANLEPGQDTFRVDDSTGIEPGSYLQISQGAHTESQVVRTVERNSHFITLDQGLAASPPFGMASGDDDVDVETQEFSMTVTHPDDGEDSRLQLAMDPRHSRYFGKVLEKEGADGKFAHVVVTAPDPLNITPAPDNLPRNIAAGPPPTTLNGGAEDDIASLLSESSNNLYQNAINSLEKIDDVNMLCIPDRTEKVVQDAMVAHCEKMQDRFAILDPWRNADPTSSNGIRGQKKGLQGSENGYAALYYPRITISNADPDVGGRITVSPSGHIAGVFARTDNTKGVHKAPANEVIKGVLELERTLTDNEAGQLNELNINVHRRIPNRGFRIWGARTIATGTQWRYVNVRRLLLFIEESIQESTEFAIFEPNNLALWETLKRQVNDFLTRVWRDGALFGATPADAFRVRVDEELNPPSERALGRLYLEVTLYPTTPAEFIVFRIIQQPGGPTIEE